ncbi:hypothetical protein DKX38_024663 [Salix brachista]|uniref:Uncharacterized protein n=1 Tax=Salix brachista TaxID=2182728 RepID=A0A5N5JQW1_9ROSI|nr:hypothetical protein DKX38_024663 [Salix brachista]
MIYSDHQSVLADAASSRFTNFKAGGRGAVHGRILQPFLMGILMMLHRQICDYSSSLMHSNMSSKLFILIRGCSSVSYLSSKNHEEFSQSCVEVIFIQSSFFSVLISHNLVIYSSVYLLHFDGSVLALLLRLLVWDCSVVYLIHVVVATFFQFSSSVYLLHRL